LERPESGGRPFALAEVTEVRKLVSGLTGDWRPKERSLLLLDELGKNGCDFM
jgi:hypothetical protein